MISIHPGSFSISCYSRFSVQRSRLKLVSIKRSGRKFKFPANFCPHRFSRHLIHHFLTPRQTDLGPGVNQFFPFSQQTSWRFLAGKLCSHWCKNQLRGTDRMKRSHLLISGRFSLADWHRVLIKSVCETCQSYIS